MTRRKTKPPLALRIIAVGCVALWLAGVSACSLEALYCCDSHDEKAIEHADDEHSHDAELADAEAHDAEPVHSHDAEGESQGSRERESKEGSCCSTLKAVVPTAKAIVFDNFHPTSFFCVLLEMHAASLALSEHPPTRQAIPHDWVFTPEVCLGPAHRSLAPPSPA